MCHLSESIHFISLQWTQCLPFMETVTSPYEVNEHSLLNPLWPRKNRVPVAVDLALQQINDTYTKFVSKGLEEDRQTSDFRKYENTDFVQSKIPKIVIPELWDGTYC